jgi:hypothetical protein
MMSYKLVIAFILNIIILSNTIFATNIQTVDMSCMLPNAIAQNLEIIIISNTTLYPGDNYIITYSYILSGNDMKNDSIFSHSAYFNGINIIDSQIFLCNEFANASPDFICPHYSGEHVFINIS